MISKIPTPTAFPGSAEIVTELLDYVSMSDDRVSMIFMVGAKATNLFFKTIQNQLPFLSGVFDIYYSFR